MGKPPPYLVEDFVKSSKNKHLCFKLLSVFPFVLLPMFFYISVFYVFKLTPSSLFSDSKFWFLLSNLLILVIAADYGAFSSSKERQDIYQDYAMYYNNQGRNHVSSYPRSEPTPIKCIPREPSPFLHEDLQDRKQTVPLPNENPERVLQIVVHSGSQKACESSNGDLKAVPDGMEGDDAMACDKRRQRRTYKRSKSDERMKRTQRSDVMQQKRLNKEDGDNEFSNMSNEELNRRVEEFIQSFNRQIRLQAASRRQQPQKLY